MKITGMILALMLISTACTTRDDSSSGQAGTPALDAGAAPVSTMTVTPFASPTLPPSPTSTAIPTENPGYKVEIVLDPTLLNEEISITGAWITYAGARSEWIQNHVTAEEIVQKGYHPAFEEEVSARSTLAKVWKDLKQSNSGAKNRYLDDLLKVYEAGFIREYIWTFRSPNKWLLPDGLRLQEFASWAKRNIPNHRPETRAVVKITLDK